MARAVPPSRTPAISDIEGREANALAAPGNDSGNGEAAAPLSVAERRKRLEAVRFANASIGLEGFKVSTEAQVRAEQFVAGEIDLAKFLQID
jgi:Antitoxin VbhA